MNPLAGAIIEPMAALSCTYPATRLSPAAYPCRIHRAGKYPCICFSVFHRDIPLIFIDFILRNIYSGTYQGKLWLLNSGTGEFGYIDDDKFIPVTFCPGFVRGLAFWKNYALVGLSKLRSKSFCDLALETRLMEMNQTPQCGLMVIDLTSGHIVHWLHIDGIVEELFDVVVLPNVRQAHAFGFQNDDIERCVSFPESNGIVVTKPTVKRPAIGASAPLSVQAPPFPACRVRCNRRNTLKPRSNISRFTT